MTLLQYGCLPAFGLTVIHTVHTLPLILLRRTSAPLCYTLTPIFVSTEALILTLTTKVAIVFTLFAAFSPINVTPDAPRRPMQRLLLYLFVSLREPRDSVRHRLHLKKLGKLNE